MPHFTFLLLKKYILNSRYTLRGPISQLEKDKYIYSLCVMNFGVLTVPKKHGPERVHREKVLGNIKISTTPVEMI